MSHISLSCKEEGVATAEKGEKRVFEEEGVGLVEGEGERVH